MIKQLHLRSAHKRFKIGTWAIEKKSAGSPQRSERIKDCVTICGIGVCAGKRKNPSDSTFFRSYSQRGHLGTNWLLLLTVHALRILSAQPTNGPAYVVGARVMDNVPIYDPCKTSRISSRSKSTEKFALVPPSVEHCQSREAFVCAVRVAVAPPSLPT